MQPLSDHEKALAKVSAVLFCKSHAAVTLLFGALFPRGGFASARGTEERFIGTTRESRLGRKCVTV